ncbi:MAG: fumarylacetoacetate hydrolase family protein [Spirochaetia bacterium]|jgi:2-keto-4-pentenoate hydratase/2-oxohepta-3-ene-1,7-dioic acid hydratase in catechol pathway|nr:fumarylacetoacetate hydrolase family protein [Spirochaetia bacterium]
MKYVRYGKNNTISYGLLEQNGKIRKIDGNPFDSYTETATVYDINEINLLTPCIFSKALCIGLNYRDHAVEFGLPIPTSPVVFMKPSTSMLPYGGTVVKPEICQRLDYEAELAIVIGKKAHNVSEDAAKQYILGYTCANDITARDLQPKQGQWTIAKGFDTFCPFGPFISDEVDPAHLDISSTLDGKVMQSSNTSNLIFPVPFLVSYLSSIMTLLPGDIILTGTPGGISGMQKGARIEIKIEGLGTLVNTIG